MGIRFRWGIVRKRGNLTEYWAFNPERWVAEWSENKEWAHTYGSRREARYGLAYGRSRRDGFQNAQVIDLTRGVVRAGPGKFKYNLSDEIIVFIRQATAAPTLKELARYYGISHSHVHHISNGSCYKHIKAPRPDWRKNAPAPLPSVAEAQSPDVGVTS